MTQCILCGGEIGAIAFPYGTRWSGRGYEYRRCRKCRCKVVDPIPSGPELEDMYRYSHYHSEYYATLESEVCETLLPEFLPLLERGGRLLDFGCGNGSFLRLAKEAGFRAEGIEIDAETRKIASANSSCPVVSLDEAEKAQRRYDIIHLGDVLEHLPAPAATLRRLEELLAPRGNFFIEGPLEDNSSLVYFSSRLFGSFKKLLRRDLLGDAPPFHLTRTDGRSQRRFLESRMSYEIRKFKIYETGWPYFAATDQQPGRGLWALVRSTIGRSAVGLARLTAPLGLQLGNRFAAVALPGRS